jgi:hypothetical protein
MNKNIILIIIGAVLILAGGAVIYQKSMNDSAEPVQTLEADTENSEIENPIFAPDQKIYELRADGYGPVKIGMTVAEASEALQMPLSSNNPETDEPACFYVYPHGEPGTVGFMVTEEKIARIDVHFENPDIQTDKKIKFGSSTADVKKAYGKIRIEPHPYGSPQEKYLIFDQDDIFQIIFETDPSGNVTSLRSGKLPEVGFIEGCS